MKDTKQIEFNTVNLCLNPSEIIDNKTNAFLYNIYHENENIVFFNKSLTRPDKFIIDSHEIIQTEISIEYSIGNSAVFGIVPMKIYYISLVLLTDDYKIDININVEDFNKIIPFIESKNISEHPLVDKYNLLEVLVKPNYIDDFRRICDSL